MNAAPHSFVCTSEHERFAEFCDACQRHRYIGLCYGPPGVGKTLSARNYTRWDQVQVYGNRAFRADAIHSEICKSTVVFYTTPVVNSPGNLDREIKKWRDTLCALSTVPIRQRETARMERLLRRAEEFRDCRRNPQGYRGKAAARAEAAFHAQRERLMRLKLPDPTTLLIIDEADRLKMASLEQVRDIFDRGSVGLVLIGMPGIEKRLARYPQLYSRIGFVHHYRPLPTEELRRLLLERFPELAGTPPIRGLSSPAVLAAIVQITGGNLRLVVRLLTQIARVLEVNALESVTVDVVDTARDVLVIGTA